MSMGSSPTPLAEPADVAYAPAVPASAGPAPRRRLSGVVGQLFGVNVVLTLCGLITGPLVARSIGADGRGLLAAILVPLGIAPFVLAFGLTTYSSRIAATRTPVAKIVGTFVFLAAAIGIVFLPIGLFGAHLLGQGNPTVTLFLAIGVCVMPVTLAGGILSSVALGHERWNLVSAQQLIPPVGAAIAFGALYAANELTLARAAGITIALSVVSLVPMLRVLRGSGRPRFDRGLAGSGVAFGSQVWFVSLSQLMNHRLDQLLMVKLTTARELGLYAVAATIAGLPAMFTSAVGQAIFPRVADGDSSIVGRTSRVGLALIACTCAIGALLVPVLLPFLFGPDFEEAVPAALILLVATVAISGAGVLGTALSTRDRPGIPGLGEVWAIVVTVVGLLILLPVLGGVGAALVSVAAYSVNFAWLLFMARRRFGGSYRDYLIVTRQDISDVVHACGPAVKRARASLKRNG